MITRATRVFIMSCMALTLVAQLAACASDKQGQAAARVQERIGYPRGPWWRGDVNQTLLGVSHILVSHRDAQRSQLLLAVPGPVSGRTREQAFARALEVREELTREPSHFAALAARYSDDPGTSARAGELGFIFAPHLPETMVDALGNLRPGEVSRVVETALGYHIIKRLEVPSAQQLSATQILIGYADSKTAVRPGRSLARSRADAQRLAQNVRRRASAEPSKFSQLVETYSDSFEAAAQGDYGEWSTHARDGDPLVLSVLAGLQPGELSEVIDTPAGFRILRRDALRPRENFAFTGLLIAYDHGATRDHVRSLEEATSIADKISDKLARAPSSFDELRIQNCDLGVCKRGAQLFRGGTSGYVHIEQMVRGLRVGDVAAQPAITPFGFVFVRRADTAGLHENSPDPVNFELPMPAPLALANASPDEIAWYVNELRRVAMPKLGLDAKRAQRLEQIFDVTVERYRVASPSERATIAEVTNAEFVAALGLREASKLGAIHEQLLQLLSGTVERGR